MRVESEPVDSPLPPSAPETELPGVACGRLAIEMRGGARFITGFICSGGDLARVQRTAAQMNATGEVALRPWPQCEVLMTIDEPLAHAEPPSIRLAITAYKRRETFAFDVRMARFPGYLHVAYIQADGSVVNTSRRARGVPLALGPALEFDAMGVVDNAIEDRVRNCRMWGHLGQRPKGIWLVIRRRR